MAYLLMLGWPWFAGAFALGALVGFLTFSRAKGATFSGGWIVLLGAVALATGYGASFAEVLSGREATTLDIAVLAGLAYAAGLPLGGWLKSLAADAEKKRPAPTPIMVAPPTAPLALEPAIPLAESFIATTAAVALDSAAPSVGVLANGHAGEAAPLDGGADDLARIKGIGPKSLEKLNALGVFHYDQIATWNLDNAKWIGSAIGAPGRVERDRWIQQARDLAGAGTGR
jgi:predicted flap endonuclease-1-like 5' DNA nuclease